MEIACLLKPGDQVIGNLLELSAKSYAENALTIKTAPHSYEFIEICQQIFLTGPWVGDCNMVRKGRLGFACIFLLIPELAL